MPTELPIACSLPAADLRERLAEMAALGDEALLSARQQATHAELRFAGQARDRVEAIVAAEAECCPFLTMRVSDEPGAVVLTVDAPEDAKPVLDEIVAAVRPAN